MTKEQKETWNEILDGPTGLEDVALDALAKELSKPVIEKHERLHKTFAPLNKHEELQKTFETKAPAKPDILGTPVEGYDTLGYILRQAYAQAAIGKGSKRHAKGVVGFMAWHFQPILANARQVGPGGPAFQVMKKTQESVTMAGNKDFAAAKAEALGAIVYAAALYQIYHEMEMAAEQQ